MTDRNEDGSALFQGSILFENVAKNRTCLISPTGEVTTSASPIPHDLLDDTIAMLKDVIYLFDAAGNQKAHEPVALDELSSYTLVTASPNKSHYQNFKKRSHVVTYYMPSWTFKELNSVLPCVPATLQSTLPGRFEQFGGVPKIIWCSPQEKYDGLVSALESKPGLTVASVQSLLGKPDVPQEIGSLIFHYEVEKGYCKASIRFATPTIANMVADHMNGLGLTSLATLVGSTLSVPAVCGHFFEKYANQKLEQGGTHTLFGENNTQATVTCKFPAADSSSNSAPLSH